MQVAGLSGIKDIAATTTSMAVRSDGTLWGWGNNGSGQIGDGTTTERHSPVQVQGISDVKQVAGGYYYFSLALKNDGAVWAWGYNYHGALGDGTTTERHAPSPCST